MSTPDQIIIPSAMANADLCNWYAVYTAVNQEKRVSEQMRQRGIEHFLPLYRSVRRRTDRRVVLDLPLFPGYLFVHINLANRLRVLELPRVVRLVGTAKSPSAIDDQAIQSLRAGLSFEGKIEPHSYLVRGCKVRVVRGPFSGSTGILLRRKQDLRVVISLDVIRQAFTVEVGEEDLERVF
jgi:transcription antitermination factor NusG